VGGARSLEGGIRFCKYRSDGDSTETEIGKVHGEWWKHGKAPKASKSHGGNKEQAD
jgi:hypothetical protein